MRPCVKPGMSATSAIVTHPCVEPGMSVTGGIAQQPHSPCHKPAVSKDTLCVAKCMDSDKLPGFTNVTVLPAPTVAILVLPVIADSDRKLSAMDRHRASLALSPPKSILFCSFLI